MANLTANYGWTKPVVGGDTDAWGGELNADLDGIDSTVHGVQTSIPAASSSAPAMDGTGAPGVATTFARGDHVHPTDTSRYATSNPAGYQTAANVTASLGSYLPLAGGSLTGALQGVAPAAGDNSAAVPTTAWVQANARFGENRIINGDMRIDQRNVGAAGTASGYTVDRWQYGAVQAGKITWQRVTTANGDFPYALRATSASAYTPLAGDTFYFFQPIEADYVTDFKFGAANAQPVTLSFWVYSSLTGTFSGSITNSPATRSYPFAYSIPTANAWTKIVLTIPGDTAGTWTLTGNAAGVLVYFELGGGTTYRAPANAWAAGNFTGANGAVSLVATSGATLYVTGVKLEIGSIATPYNRQSMTKSLADCQRYFEKSYDDTIAPGAVNSNGVSSLMVMGVASSGTNNAGRSVDYKVTKRGSPTITMYSPNTGAVGKARDNQNSADTTVTLNVSGMSGFSWFAAPSAATTVFNFLVQWTASAEL